MNKYKFTVTFALEILILLLLFSNYLYSEQLKDMPVFLEPGKKLNQQDINFYFEHCGSSKINDNVFLLKYGVYSIRSGMKFYWEYDLKEKDFKVKTHSQVTKPCSVRNKYHVYIWTTKPPPKEIEYEILNTKYRLSSYKHISANNQFISLTELYSLRLATYNGSLLDRFQKTCFCTYFDSNGYAYIQYRLNHEKCCKKGHPPEKPDITSRGNSRIKFVSARDWKKKRSNVKRPMNQEFLNKPDLRPKKEISWQGMSYKFNDRFGYVHYKNNFSSQKKFNNDYIMLLLPKNISSPVAFSPIKCSSGLCMYSLPSVNYVESVITNFNDEKLSLSVPVAKVTNSNFQELKEYSRLSKLEINALELLEKIQLTSNRVPDAVEELKNLFCGNNQQECIQAYQSLLKLKKTLIQNAGQQNYTQENEGKYFLINSDYTIELNDTLFNHTLTLHKNKTNNLDIIDTTSLRGIKYKKKSLLTSWNQKFQYLKIKILHSDDYFFQSIENQTFKELSFKSQTISSVLKKYPIPFFFEKQKIGIWLIIDDYKDSNGIHLQKLHKFKTSPAFENLLKSALNSKTNNFYRIDRIQGNSVERIYDKNAIFSNSDFRHIADIKALKYLENHKNSNNIDKWELHLFLGQNTDQKRDKPPDQGVINKLEELQVIRTFVWEFNYFESKQSFYLNYFKKIYQKQPWNFKYKQITKESMFKDIRIP